MQIKIDDEVILEISETQLKIIAHDIPTHLIKEDLTHRITNAVLKKVEACADRIRREYEPIVEADPTIEFIPKTTIAFVGTIFDRPEYKNRDKRDEESEAQRQKELEALMPKSIDDIIPVVDDGK